MTPMDPTNDLKERELSERLRESRQRLQGLNIRWGSPGTAEQRHQAGALIEITQREIVSIERDLRRLRGELL